MTDDTRLLRHNRTRRALGAAIRHHRGSRTQDEVARAIGVTQAALSLYERGARDLGYEQVHAIERALDLRPGTLGMEAGFIQAPPPGPVKEFESVSSDDIGAVIASAVVLGLGVQINGTAETDPSDYIFRVVITAR